MKNQRTHLLPNEVEELKELGVEFANTQLVWVYSHRIGFICSDSLAKKMMGEPKYNVLFGKKEAVEFNYNYISAPNLQEVLEILPKEIDNAEIDINFNWNWVFEYVEYSFPHNSGAYEVNPIITYTNNNPLTAAFELLKWTATNHKELIKQ